MSDRITTLHGITWLAVGNAVGVLLALLLLFPPLHGLLGPLTYGRWIPVHLNIQLYGWCAIPLVGLLFRLYMPQNTKKGEVDLRKLALDAWSAALLFGVFTWLMGKSSGKIFLDWTGGSRIVLVIAMYVLWGVLLAGFLRQKRKAPASRRSERLVTKVKWGLLAFLFIVPIVMYVASSPAIYPPINKDSGGPTGTSLLGSTLGLIPIFIYLPYLLKLRIRRGNESTLIVTIALMAHFIAFAFLKHGNASNHEPQQILALMSLIPWVPALLWHLSRVEWPPSCRPWLWAMCLWASYLVGSAVIEFLPIFLGHVKFTNALVAHSHAAMAGMLTSFNVLILIALAGCASTGYRFHERWAFWSWQIGCVLYVASMTALGFMEGQDPGLLFRHVTVVDGFYALRLLAGLAMFAASCGWLRGAFVAQAQNATQQTSHDLPAPAPATMRKQLT